MKVLTQNEALEIGKIAIKESSAIKPLIDKFKGRLSFGGQFRVPAKTYRVGLYLGPPPPSDDELSKIDSNEGEVMECIAYCDVQVETGSKQVVIEGRTREWSSGSDLDGLLPEPSSD